MVWKTCDGGPLTVVSVYGYVRASCWPERRGELLIAPSSPFPLIFLAGFGCY